MRPPTVKVLNATAIQVSWQEPINPNGQMERYLISLTNRQIEQRNVSVFSQLVTGLTPYTRYDVTVAACTSTLTHHLSQNVKEGHRNYDAVLTFYIKCIQPYIPHKYS